MARSPLFPLSHDGALCAAGSSCPEAVVLVEGRWFITAGHRGFNADRNQVQGWPTSAEALAVVDRLDRLAGAYVALVGKQG